MKELLSTACKLLEQGEGFVLARVINRLGSAPRTAGAQMIILEDSSISGTIGGGRSRRGLLRPVGVYLTTREAESSLLT